MNKDQEETIAGTSNQLRDVSDRLSRYHSAYEKMLDELHETLGKIKGCEKAILDMFKKEMAGRNLSEGVSDKQFVLSCVSNSLAVGMEGVEAICKKMNGTMDRLKESEKAVGIYLKFLDGIE